MNMSNGKVFHVNQEVVDTYDNTMLLCYKMTAREAVILMAQLQYIQWATRWRNLTYTPEQLTSIQERISDALMTPEICATEGDNMQLRLENCVLEYSNDDGETWFPVSGWDLEECLVDSTYITNIVNDITTIEGDVTNVTNEITNIENDVSNVTNEITNINATINNVSGGGGLICIGNVTLETSESFMELAIDTLPYEFIEVVIRHKHTGGATATGMSMMFNSDSTGANYVSNAPSAGMNIGNQIGAAFPFGHTKIRIPNPLSEDFPTVSQIENSYGSTSGAVRGNYTHIWFPTYAIETIHVTGATNFASGSSMSVYGYLCSDAETEPTLPDWIAEISVSDPEIGIVEVLGDAYYDGGLLVSQTGASGEIEVRINIGEAAHIVYVASSFFPAGMPSGTPLVLDRVVPNSMTIANGTWDGTNPTTLEANMNITASILGLKMSYSGALTTSRLQMGVYQIAGTGTIPASLAPYEI